MTSQRNEIYKYKIDTTTDGNFIPIRMFQTLYPNTQIMDFN